MLMNLFVEIWNGIILGHYETESVYDDIRNYILKSFVSSIWGVQWATIWDHVTFVFVTSIMLVKFSTAHFTVHN